MIFPVCDPWKDSDPWKSRDHRLYKRVSTVSGKTMILKSGGGVDILPVGLYDPAESSKTSAIEMEIQSVLSMDLGGVLTLTCLSVLSGL